MSDTQKLWFFEPLSPSEWDAMSDRQRANSVKARSHAGRVLRVVMLIVDASQVLNDPLETHQRRALKRVLHSLCVDFRKTLEGLDLQKQKEPVMDYVQACFDAIENYIAAAVHTLGDAIDRAHRHGFTETRREVAVCVEAFNILTAKEATA